MAKKLNKNTISEIKKSEPIIVKNTATNSITEAGIKEKRIQRMIIEVDAELHSNFKTLVKKRKGLKIKDVIEDLMRVYINESYD